MHPFRKQFYLFCVIKEFLNALFSCFNIRHTHKILTITCVLTSAKEIIYTRIKHRQKKSAIVLRFCPLFYLFSSVVAYFNARKSEVSRHFFYLISVKEFQCFLFLQQKQMAED